MKRIFYFNITYSCNNQCIFCYSHNTRRCTGSYNELSARELFYYLEMQQISSEDRIIINGGEPLMHSEIDEILYNFSIYGCEVLVYTNGRLLNQHDFSTLNEKFRFIVPIHGTEAVHDSITRVKGSYKETLEGRRLLMNSTKCKIDIKIIINKLLLSEDFSGENFIAAFDKISFNNAVHITKMADTIVSKRNECESVSNASAAYYTKMLFDYFKEREYIIKFFDTCVKKICVGESFMQNEEPIIVFFKDKKQSRTLDLKRKDMTCMNECMCKEKCMSAVDEYKVLEYFEGHFFENLE